ncbi:MAG: hypothetical protein HYS27_11760 [Deltaproteobacteria bacterium]|nr:hypothetical protein [Deltaproteobacteria bacterium]
MADPRAHLRVIQPGVEVDGGAIRADASPSLSLAVRIRSRGRAVSVPDVSAQSPAAALDAALNTDVSSLAAPIATWQDQEAAVVLVIERPGGADPARSVDVRVLFPDWAPRPLAAWANLRGDLVAIFVATGTATARALAGTWAMVAPLSRFLSWPMRVQSSFEHPAAVAEGRRRGRVHRFAPSSRIVVPGAGRASDPSDDEIRAWLAERGLDYGRWPTPGCVLCGTQRQSSGSDPIVIDERGARCFRCQVFKPWSALLNRDDAEAPSLFSAARHLVHFPHQRYVLMDRRPHVPEELLQPAWAHMLREVNRARLAEQPTDAKGKPIENRWIGRVDRAAHAKKIDLVRAAAGVWLDAKSLFPRKITLKSTKDMPACVDGITTDKALDAVPVDGFMAVAPLNGDTLVGPHTVPPPGAIFVRRPARPGEPGPVDCTGRPSAYDVERAWKTLEQLLPGIHRGYVSATVMAALLAQTADGPPPILVVTGDTGTSKTTTQRLVGSMIGGGAVCVSFGRDADVTRRNIGNALVRDGASLLFVDEIGREPDPYEKLAVVLELGASIRFAAKYANEVNAPVTAPFAILGSTLPRAVVASPELSRRAVGWRLMQRAKGWERWGDLARARRHPELRAALDVVAAGLWWRAHDLGPRFDWRSLCMKELGGVALDKLDLDDAGGEERAAHIVALYELFRTGAVADMTLCAGRPGWLNASAGRDAHALIEQLVDTEAEHRRSHAETAELERVDLTKVLGFTDPALKLLVRRRSARWYVKFVQLGVARGKEMSRAELPAAVAPACDRRGDRAGPASELDALDAPDAPGPLFLGGGGRGDGGRAEDPAGQGEVVQEGAAASRPGATGASSTDAGPAPGATPPRPGIIVIDLAVRSQANAAELAGRAYAEHATTEVIGLAARLPGGAILTWIPGQAAPATLHELVTHGATLAAHNANGLVRHVWSALAWPPVARWLDLQQVARLAGLPDGIDALVALADTECNEAAEPLAPHRRPDVRTGQLPPISAPARRRILERSRRRADALWNLGKRSLRPWVAVEQRVRDVDARINARGFLFDADLADSVLALAETSASEACDAAPVDQDTLLSPHRLRAWLAEEGIDVPDVQQGHLRDLLEDDDLPDPVRRVIAARLSASSIVEAKLTAGLRRVDEDGRLRHALVYGAAHTGRWGGHGFQPQNLPRGISDPTFDVTAAVDAARASDLARLRELAAAVGSSVGPALSTLVRPCIYAGAGRMLAIVDYKSIEPRVLRWLAGDRDGLDVFRRAEDLYLRMAATLYATPVADVSKPQRQIGKALEVGCGFGMGVERFKSHAANMGVDWSASELTPERAVDAWRTANPLIAGKRVEIPGYPIRYEGGLWRDVEAAARAAARGETREVRLLRWSPAGRDIHCTLPSGRIVVYRDARIEDVVQGGRKRSVLTYARGRRRVTTYGGKLVENCTQAVARDILADALVRLDDAGHAIVLHVHDEVVAEVDSGHALSSIEAIMRAAPAWAEGLPLDVAARTAPRYGK